MNEIQRAKIVLKTLDKTYPKIHVPLKSRNVFTLLISVLLSAQCTDVNVNNVTKNIYPKFYKMFWLKIFWVYVFSHIVNIYISTLSRKKYRN